jgi:hypothetical protein
MTHPHYQHQHLLRGIEDIPPIWSENERDHVLTGLDKETHERLADYVYIILIQCSDSIVYRVAPLILFVEAKSWWS